MHGAEPAAGKTAACSLTAALLAAGNAAVAAAGVANVTFLAVAGGASLINHTTSRQI